MHGRVALLCVALLLCLSILFSVRASGGSLIRGSRRLLRVNGGRDKSRKRQKGEPMNNFHFDFSWS